MKSCLRAIWIPMRQVMIRALILFQMSSLVLTLGQIGIIILIEVLIMNQIAQAVNKIPQTERVQSLKPEEMPEYKDDQEAQYLIKCWRKDFPDWTDERIVEALEYCL